MNTDHFTLATTPTEADWLYHVRHALTSRAELAKALSLPALCEPDTKKPDTKTDNDQKFTMKVPWPYVQRMTVGNIDDPLLRQVLHRQSMPIPGWSEQPIEEHDRMPVTGVIQKYQGRVLWLITGSCAIHCQYCFRQNYDYDELTEEVKRSDKVVSWLRQQNDVEEVILSGGDPLSLRDNYLEGVMQQLCSIEHLKTIRIHTRTPIAIPQRISQEMLNWCGQVMASGKRLVVIFHCNAAAEWNDELLKSGLARLSEIGVKLYVQGVLLKEVNDSCEALKAWAESSFDLGVQPYYLHMLDPVQGAESFHVSEERAVDLYSELAACVPGYMLPKLVRENNYTPAKSVYATNF